MKILEFGRCRLDVERRLLTIDGAAAPLGPKVVETLCVLIERQGELVTKSELMDRLWPDKFVEEGNLTQNVFRLRRALAAAGMPGAIQTMARRGYRFCPPLPTTSTHLKRRLGSARIATLLLAAASLIAVLAPAPSQRPLSSAFARLSPASQRLYRLGRFHWNLRYDLTHVRESLRIFKEVAQRDPSDALGYSGLADATMSLYDLVCDPPGAGCSRIVARAERYARKAVRLDPGSPEAHTSLAMALHMFTRRDRDSDAEFERAIALDSGYALAHHWYGNSLLGRGLIARARREHETALALEPDSPATYAWLAEDAFLRGECSDAASYASESLAIDAHRRHRTLVLLGLAYECSGREAAAIAAFDRLSGPERDALIAALYAREGKRTKAAAMLAALDASRSLSSGAGVPLALAWLAVGDRKRAYAFLKAAPQANRMEHNILAMDPRLDAVRGDPHFAPWTTNV